MIISVAVVAAVEGRAVVIATKPEQPQACVSHPVDSGCDLKPAPRKGKALILASKEFAHESRTKSWWVFLSTLTYFWVCVYGTIAPWAWPARLICSVLCGLLMVRLFVIFHDHQHHAILDRSRVADFLMRLVGILALTPSSIWKSSHNYHHNNNSKLKSARIGSFPIMTRDHYDRADFKTRFEYRFMRHPLTILFGYFTVFLMGMSVLPFVEDPKKHLDGLLAILLHIALMGTLFLFGGFSAVLLAMLIPYSIAMALGTYLFYVQHNFPDVLFRDRKGWTYEGAAMDSSSFLRLPRIMHWFTANIGYHHIHHLNAKIPFYRLPEAMKAMPELQQPKSSSLHPAEIWRCLKLAVWDVDAQRMVPLPK